MITLSPSGDGLLGGRLTRWAYVNSPPASPEPVAFSVAPGYSGRRCDPYAVPDHSPDSHACEPRQCLCHTSGRSGCTADWCHGDRDHTISALVFLLRLCSCRTSSSGKPAQPASLIAGTTRCRSPASLMPCCRFDSDETKREDKATGDGVVAVRAAGSLTRAEPSEGGGRFLRAFWPPSSGGRRAAGDAVQLRQGGLEVSGGAGPALSSLVVEE